MKRKSELRLSSRSPNGFHGAHTDRHQNDRSERRDYACHEAKRESDWDENNQRCDRVPQRPELELPPFGSRVRH